MADSTIEGLTSGTPTTDDLIIFYDNADSTTKKAAISALPVGAGDVTASAVIADNAIVRGDGGAKGVQSSGTSISDVNNISANNFFASSATTAAASGTTILTVASARTQNLTGATTHTFQLPDATTLALSTIFEFNNNSSGSLTITNAGAASQYVIPAGGAVKSFCTNIGSVNGTWDFHALAPSSVTWGSGIVGLVMNSVLSTSPSVASGASSSTVPSFIPQRGASTTGLGGDGTSLFAIIAGSAAATFSATRSIFPIVETTGVIELGNTSDTTISRVSAGVIAVEGVTVPTISSTSTITNKRQQPRIVSAASYTTDTGTSLDVSTTDIFVITAQAGALLFNSPSGTPVQGEKLMIRIKDNGTARALTWNAVFRAMGTALPTTTVLSKTLYLGFVYNSTDTKWDLIASAQEA